MWSRGECVIAGSAWAPVRSWRAGRDHGLRQRASELEATIKCVQGGAAGRRSGWRAVRSSFASRGTAHLLCFQANAGSLAEHTAGLAGHLRGSARPEAASMAPTERSVAAINGMPPTGGNGSGRGIWARSQHSFIYQA